MTEILKTNDQDERRQISEALTSVESDVSTNTSAISSLDTRVTALEGGVDGTPPTALKGIPISNSDIDDVMPTAPTTIGILYSASTGTQNSWTTIHSETGEGIIEFMNAYQVANSSSRAAQLRLSIDGTTVYTSDADLWQASGDTGDGVCLVGSASDAEGFLAFGRVRYSTSFTLEFQKTAAAAGTVEIGARIRYYETA